MPRSPVPPLPGGSPRERETCPRRILYVNVHGSRIHHKGANDPDPPPRGSGSTSAAHRARSTRPQKGLVPAMVGMNLRTACEHVSGGASRPRHACVQHARGHEPLCGRQGSRAQRPPAGTIPPPLHAHGPPPPASHWRCTQDPVWPLRAFPDHSNIRAGSNALSFPPH